MLVTGQDVTAIGLPGEDEDAFSWAEVARRLKDGQRLSGLGEQESAYLTLWIAFERMMRFQARRVALPVDRLAPSILIRQLYSNGELSMAQFDSALECQTVRNRIVHGFPAASLGKAVANLDRLERELMEQWSSPQDES